MNTSVSNKYAVVGLGCIVPDAANVGQFWQNILTRRVSIEPYMDDALGQGLFYCPQAYGKGGVQDKSYTNLAARIKSIEFDPWQFRIAPNVAAHMDLNQKVSLLSARQALADGALETVSKDRVSVFIGGSMSGPMHHEFLTRFDFERFACILRNDATIQASLSASQQLALVEDLRAKALAGTIPVTEDSAPGTLPSITAARIASAFDLHGHALVVDAACASALAAIICGVQQLRSHEADAVICGAADMLCREAGFIYFSAVGALSPDGSFPFDARANGFVMGQGAGVVVIKRLGDALEQNDRIYAIITGYGQASDGKGKAITAPNSVWQAKTIQRAWEMGNASAETIGLIEAHGTATQVGDISEVAALKSAFSAMGAREKAICGIGSVKSNIGHLKSAAGIAGFLKAVLALHHKVLPPTAGFERANPKLELDDSPFYVVSSAREWPSREYPRRVGVNAFGFGGADYHLALEEFRKEDYTNARAGHRSTIVPPPPAASAKDGKLSTDVAFLSADSTEELLSQADELVARIRRASDRGVEELFAHNYTTRPTKRLRLAFTVSSVEGVGDQIARFKQVLRNPQGLGLLKAKGIYFGDKARIASDQMAFLFPGQGSQYANMGLALKERYAAARTLFARGDALWSRIAGQAVSTLVDASARGTDETERLLADTRNAHPAMMVATLATFAVLKEMNVAPRAMVGHSLGELIALTAAGRLALDDALRLMAARGDSFAQIDVARRGGMAAVAVDRMKVEQLIADASASLTIANFNGPNQTVVSGDILEVDSFVARCEQQHVKAVRLNVSHAFHSPLMESAKRAFMRHLFETPVHSSGVQVLGNESNEYYGDREDSVRTQLAGHITGPVRFQESIERLYADGVRLFVEVGPGSVLASLTRSILSDRDAVVLSSDSKKSAPLEGVSNVLCGLFASGVSVELTPPTAVRTDGRQPDVCAAESVGLTVSKDSPSILGEAIVYSGVSVGLPGSFKRAFRDDNFEQLFEGRNFIERLTDSERTGLVDLRISKLVKSESGASFVLLQSMNEVIQLAGKIGQIDLLQDYFVDEKDARTMSNAIALAVAAGYEALRDAHIPLIHEYVGTSSGRVLPDRWALPQEMQRETGVIFANGFPLCEAVVAEVSRYVGYKFRKRLRDEVFEFYDALITKVTDEDSRRLLADWFALNYSRLRSHPSEDEVYSFNHQFMNQLSLQANNRLAQFINAFGPNFQINAACSSAATAITLAEELIRSGRVKRMLVVGADAPTSEGLLPYIGGGFLATGACSTEGDLYEAAVPFDKRRNGMIMGAGAIGIVVEAKSECDRRGVVPVCELLGSHCFNTAGHHSQLNASRYAEELELFVKRMEHRFGLQRETLANQLLYMSHEPYTPPRGGCSDAEASSLRHVFGERYSNILVTNTKGMTGHAMAASVEDATAAKALQYSKVPPVVHHRVADPDLLGLNLSKGGDHDKTYALRMAAGFGSQGNYILLKKTAEGDARVADREKYEEWLASVSGLPKPECEVRGRVLSIKDERPGTVITQRRPSSAPPGMTTSVSPRMTTSVPPPMTTSVPPRMTTSVPPRMTTSIPPRMTSNAPLRMASSAPGSGTPVAAKTTSSARPPVTSARDSSAGPMDSRDGAVVVEGKVSGANGEPTVAARVAPVFEVEKTVFGVIGEVTGFRPEMLDLDMDVEADLGVDTVRQATILAKLFERFGLGEDNGFRVSDFPSIRRIVEHFELRADHRPRQDSVDLGGVGGSGGLSMSASGSDERMAGVAAAVFQVIASITGFAAESLTADMGLESDLGVDTVKQATILATLDERLGTGNQNGFRMSDVSSIGDIIRLWSGRLHELSERKTNGDATTTGSTPAAREPEGAVIATSSSRTGEPSLESTVVSVVAQVTGYPPEMLASDITMRGDMGLDDRAIEEIRIALLEAFRLDESWVIEADASMADVARSIGATQAHPRSAAEPLLSISRQVLKLRPAPTGDQANDLTGKVVWVVGDDERVVDRVRQALASLGSQCEGFAFPSSRVSESVLSAVRRLEERGAPDIFVDATACGAVAPAKTMNASDTCAWIERTAKGRFETVKYLGQTNNIPRRILAVTAIDGSFGLQEQESAPVEPVFGLYAGFYKALRREWPDTHVSILDVGPLDVDEQLDSAVERVISELSAHGPGVEICYRGGVRQRLVVEDVALSPRSGEPHLSFDKTDVILATGGGAGITSKVVRELAGHGASTFVLTGRTEIVPGVERLAALSAEELKEEEVRLGHRLAAEGTRVTPVVVAREFGKIERSIEIHRTMEDLRARGCRVRYYAADIRDSKRMTEILHDVRSSFGPVSVVIHGAGIDLSRPLQQKSWDEFREVLGTKTFGAVNLSTLCHDDPIKLIVGFSSIAGRFGSAGQVDYSAANGFLDQWVRAFARMKVARGISLVWSGWEEMGMAWRSSFVREGAEAMGLNLIEPNEGARAAVREMMLAIGPVDVVLHKGLGPLLDSAMVGLDLSPYPLIDRVEMSPSGIKSVHRRFGPVRDAFVDQHRFGKTPLMPGVGLMEFMAEAYCLVANECEGALVFRDLEFSDALLFHREKPRDVVAELEPIADSHRVKMVIKSPFKPVLAQAAEWREYSRAMVSVESRETSEIRGEDWEISDTHRRTYRSVLLEGVGIARNVVFGPLFNDARGDNGGEQEGTLTWSDHGICTPVRFPKAQWNNPRYPLAKFRINPAFLDVVHQAGAVWGMLVTKDIYLPSSAEEFVVMRPPKAMGEYRVVAMAKNVSAERIIFNIAMWNPLNQVCCFVKNSMFRKVKQ